MRQPRKKLSERYDSITIRTKRGDGLLETLRQIAKEESERVGCRISINDIGHAALRIAVNKRSK
jgi:hypothetical protein